MPYLAGIQEMMKVGDALTDTVGSEGIRFPVSVSGFPGGSDGKESACNARDLCSIPGLGRSPGEGNGNSFQHSCLENPVGRGAWWATVHEVTKSQT